MAKFSTTVQFKGEINIQKNKMNFCLIKDGNKKIIYSTIIFEPVKRKLHEGKIYYEQQYNLYITRKLIKTSNSLDELLTLIYKELPIQVPQEAINAYKAACSLVKLQSF